MAQQIYIVEDHPVVRRGLISLIEPEPGLTIIGGTGSAQEARQEIPEAAPDIVLLDLSIEDGTGLTLLEHLHNTQPDLPVLVVSMHDENLYARRALEAGARGYLMKDKADSKVVEAIREVLDGNVYLSPEMTSSILSSKVGGPTTQDLSPFDTLSDRELEVFTLMGEGRERREIAEALSLSPKTVDSHKDNLKRKLSLDTTAGLRRYAAIWVAADGSPAK